MPKEVRLWRVAENRLTVVPDVPLDLERRIQDWIEIDPGVLGEQLLVIGREVLTAFGGSIDLLCLDGEGDLVLVELKRDRTPREVTAQLLDYASWAAELKPEAIAEIASKSLQGRSLESAFQKAFGAELPEIINESHRMLVVGASVDPATERIIRYLSDKHGVSINAVTFQHFQLPSGEELIARVHLIEPDRVEQQATVRGSSKRRRRLSREELDAAANQHGVGATYRDALARFEPLFSGVQTTRSSLRFVGDFGDGRGAVLNLIPTDAKAGALPFQLYTNRAARIFDLTPATLVGALPPGARDWKYTDGDDDWWHGHEGVFGSPADCRRLADLLGNNGDSRGTEP